MNTGTTMAGVGLRTRHHADILSMGTEVAWLEAHSENYFGDGGPLIDCLLEIRSHYPLSLHGVGLSLGSVDPLDRGHLRKIQRSISRFEPWLISEHLSWSSVDGVYVNDLLPLPYTEEALLHVSDRVTKLQDFLGRQILIENVSSYFRYEYSNLREWEFLAGVAAEAGCGVLLDLNNIYVAAHNHGFDCQDYLFGIPLGIVQELHLAGHTSVDLDGRPLLIDTHGGPVCDAVWELYRSALQRFGNVPTLIEWDTDIPKLDVLQAEADKADSIRNVIHADAA